LELLYAFFADQEANRVWLNTPHLTWEVRLPLEIILKNKGVLVQTILETLSLRAS
jgi:uncharacterized protein (DUF2384 family)